MALEGPRSLSFWARPISSLSSSSAPLIRGAVLTLNP